MKRLVLIMLAMTMLLSGCGNNKNSAKGKEPKDDVSSKVSEDAASSEESSKPDPVVERSAKENIEEQIATLQKDIYPELQITAAVLERKAILPGDIFKVSISVTNSGTKDVSFENGSGSYAVPESIKIYIDGMQVIPQQDRLGPVTLDLSYKSIKAGETLTFDYYVAAIKESDEFMDIASQFFIEQDKYIGDMSPEELLKAYPDLVVSDNGGYQGQVFFTYMAPSESGEVDLTMSANGYAQAEFGITIG